MLCCNSTARRVDEHYRSGLSIMRVSTQSQVCLQSPAFKHVPILIVYPGCAYLNINFHLFVIKSIQIRSQRSIYIYDQHCSCSSSNHCIRDQYGNKLDGTNHKNGRFVNIDCMEATISYWMAAFDSSHFCGLFAYIQLHVFTLYGNVLSNLSENKHRTGSQLGITTRRATFLGIYDLFFKKSSSLTNLEHVIYNTDLRQTTHSSNHSISGSIQTNLTVERQCDIQCTQMIAFCSTKR